jgi:ubiquinone/menaquinone biosynthesis C-methylase UbiE
MDDRPPELDPAIAGFYQAAAEEHRLKEGASLLEALRTKELIERYAPGPPKRVIDIGGGAGAYATWLADTGYEVHLVDAAPRLVEEARRQSASTKRPLASCEVGDARATHFADSTADIVLLLGPLYHLTNANERHRALREAARILAPRGVLFAAAISRWASTLDGLVRDLFQDSVFVAIVDRDLRDGQHRNATSRLDYFTTAYFHKPDDLRGEIANAGLLVEGVFGVEGPGWLLQDVSRRLDDPRMRADLLRVARTCETEPSLLGVSAHLLAVARKTV